MTTRVKFFYANGTSWAVNWIEVGLRVAPNFGTIYFAGQDPVVPTTGTVLGINGRSAKFDGQPQNDIFPQLLDPTKFDAVRVKYPAAMFPMGNSIAYGVNEVVNSIKALPKGQPYALGGYSQGAAVMSGVYNEIRSGTLTSRANDFLGAVMFGNPRRQVNHRGAVGGTWSGAYDVDNSTTGGHGSFPATGPFARLTNCESKWVEFAYPGDVITSVGDSTLGQNWVLGNSEILTLDVGQLIEWFLTGAAQAIGDAVGTTWALGGEFIDVLDGEGTALSLPGGGHVAYPFLPPYGLTGETCYQVALRYLESLADSWATASILTPRTSAGWSTTLLPPP